MAGVALQPLRQRHVPGNLRRADDRAITGFDRGDGQRDIDGVPVLRPTNRFVVIDPFARTNLAENVVLLPVTALAE